MDDGDKDFFLRCFRGEVPDNPPCRWCGGIHAGECPRVKHIVYHPSDAREVREVEFWPDGEWNRGIVIFPEDVA